MLLSQCHGGRGPLADFGRSSFSSKSLSLVYNYLFDDLIARTPDSTAESIV